MTTLAAVTGWPVGHSRSPAMQNAAFQAAGLDWRYLKLPLPPERFAGTVAALHASGYAGLNVTIPHKAAAFELADERTPACQAIGAANTLLLAEEGIRADNTDAGGFLDALGEPVAGREALVLGAGGAARAVVWALLDAGAARVAVWNRTPKRARELAEELGAEHAEHPVPAGLVVNATSVGLGGSTGRAEALEAVEMSAAQPPELFCDLVYGEGATPLEEWAAAGGSRVVSGREVLLGQGARSFELWTGESPPVEAMRAALGPA